MRSQYACSCETIETITKNVFHDSWVDVVLLKVLNKLEQKIIKYRVWKKKRSDSEID